MVVFAYKTNPATPCMPAGSHQPASHPAAKQPAYSQPVSQSAHSYPIWGEVWVGGKGYSLLSQDACNCFQAATLHHRLFILCAQRGLSAPGAIPTPSAPTHWAHMPTLGGLTGHSDAATWYFFLIIECKIVGGWPLGAFLL